MKKIFFSLYLVLVAYSCFAFGAGGHASGGHASAHTTANHATAAHTGAAEAPVAAPAKPAAPKIAAPSATPAKPEVSADRYRQFFTWNLFRGNIETAATVQKEKCKNDPDSCKKK